MVALLEPCPTLTASPPLAPSRSRISYGKPPDANDLFEQRAEEFFNDCAEFESESKKHIYDAADAPQMFYLVHAAWLSKLILNGQSLRLLAAENGFEDAPQAVAVRDKTAELVNLLYDWHGVPGTHPDEPPTLIESLREAAAGKILQEDW